MKKALALLVLVPLIILSLSWDALGRALGPRDLDPAIVSASLQIDKAAPIALKPEAVPALSGWLNRQATGWEKLLYTPPLRERWVVLTYGDGSTVSLQLFETVIIASRRDKKGFMTKPVPPNDQAELVSFFQTGLNP